MNFVQLLKQIQEDEGERLQPYRDSVHGVWTIGFGTTRILGVPVSEHTRAITHDSAIDLLMADIFRACIDAQISIPNFNSLSPDRQEVLVNMAYNLGRGGLKAFVRMREAIVGGDFERAKAEMIDSRWYGQVGDRARRLSERMA